jgi:hypothetical protein
MLWRTDAGLQLAAGGLLIVGCTRVAARNTDESVTRSTLLPLAPRQCTHSSLSGPIERDQWAATRKIIPDSKEKCLHRQGSLFSACARDCRTRHISDARVSHCTSELLRLMRAVVVRVVCVECVNQRQGWCLRSKHLRAQNSAPERSARISMQAQRPRCACRGSPSGGTERPGFPGARTQRLRDGLDLAAPSGEDERPTDEDRPGTDAGRQDDVGAREGEGVCLRRAVRTPVVTGNGRSPTAVRRSRRVAARVAAGAGVGAGRQGKSCPRERRAHRDPRPECPQLHIPNLSIGRSGLIPAALPPQTPVRRTSGLVVGT